MSRNISGPSIDRNKYVLQVHNGGSGCVSIEELKEKFGLIREDEFNTPNGVLAYDDKGNVPLQALPTELITRSTVNIRGKSSIFPGTVNEYIIDNYDSSLTYTAEYSGGTAIVSGNKITVTAGNLAGEYELTINGEKFKIVISAGLPRIPKITASGILTNNGNESLIKIDTVVVIDNGGFHRSNDFQISRTENFGEVIIDIKDSPSLNSVVIQSPKLQKYYIRSRSADSYGQRSEWSNVVKLEGSTFSSEVATPSFDFNIFKDDDRIKIILSTAGFYSNTGEEIDYVQMQVSTNSNFNTVLATETWTDFSNLKMSFNSLEPVLYLRVRHVSKNGKTSGWSEISKIDTNAIYSTAPVVEGVHILNPIPNGNDEYTPTKGFGNEIRYFPQTKQLFVAALSDGFEGTVFMYSKTLDGWNHTRTFRANSEDVPNFGRSIHVSSDGGLLMLGTMLTGTTDTGFVQLYDNVDGEWVYKSTIVSPAAAGTVDWYGCHCTSSGNGEYIAVGAYRDNNYVGKVYVYKRNSQGLYDLQTTISEAEVAAGWRYGHSAVLSEDGIYLLTAAMNALDKGGIIYLYKRTGNSWNRIQRIEGKTIDQRTASMGITFDWTPNFETVVVGDRHYNGSSDVNTYMRTGGVIVFRRNGESLVYEASFPAADYENQMQSGAGSIYDAENDRIFVPSTGGTSHPGRIMIFERVNGVWTKTNQVGPYSPRVDVPFGGGFRYIPEDSTLIVSAVGLDGGAGRVIEFRPQVKLYEKKQQLRQISAAWFESFASGISKTGDWIIMSRYGNGVQIYKRVGNYYNHFQEMPPSDFGRTDGFGNPFYIKPLMNKDGFIIPWPSPATVSDFKRSYIDIIEYSESLNKFVVTESVTLDNPNIYNQTYNHLSIALSADGTTMAIGSVQTVASSPYSGKVFIYKRVNNLWTLNQTIECPEERPVTTTLFFGNRIAMSSNGKYLAVNSGHTLDENGNHKGGYSQMWIYELDAAGNSYNLIYHLPYDADLRMGERSIRAIVWSDLTNEFITTFSKPTNTQYNPVLVGFRVNSDKSVSRRDIAYGPLVAGSMGYSLVITKDSKKIIAGSPDYGENGNNIGCLIVFTYVDGNYKLTDIIKGDHTSNNARIGLSLDICFDTGMLLGLNQPYIQSGQVATVEDNTYFTIIE